MNAPACRAGEPGFPGSYEAGDITFLLTPVTLAPTGLAEKEALIQSGRRHYSEMISEEPRPDGEHLAIFRAAWARHRDRLAAEVRALAAGIAARVARGELAPQVTLCSLVRAGVPVGVLLRRTLAAAGVDVAHYGVSIIRDRGLDAAAMEHIRARRPEDGIVFVDGWTGKGVIAAELRRSWRGLAGREALLAVLADPCGAADLAGSREDWLIPSGLLGANVSGLVSRSILIPGAGGFHGTVPVAHLADMDFSRAFVEDIDRLAREPGPAQDPAGDPADTARTRAAATLEGLQARFGPMDPNRIKPGIAEATRAVLRRCPDLVILREAGDPDLAGLVHLCRRGGVRMVEDGALTGPWRAVTLIGRAGA